MELLQNLTGFLVSLPTHLDQIMVTLGPIAYLILWLAIFLETGAVIMAWLPGESLIFAAAAFSAVTGKMSIWILIPLFLTATFLGDTSSFFIGRFVGKKYTHISHMKIVKPEQFQKAHKFFAEKGKKAYLINRFIPVARALMPFTAGFVQTDYSSIFHFSLAGVVIWNTLYLALGYFLGNLPIVSENFSLISISIIILSIIPASFIILRNLGGIMSGKLLQGDEKDKDSNEKPDQNKDRTS